MELEKCNAVVMMREYRKGNWSLEETLVLIDAKKLDEERRMVKNNSTPSNAHSTTTMIKPSGELRWKWIEEYCWKKGCLRSQNQCNDKWDNLMRDFKKVREFERRSRRRCDNEDEEEEHKFNSYWKMDKIERKNHNLPSSMLPQIYEALNHVMEAKLGISVLPAMVLHPCTTAPPPLPPPPPLPETARLPSPTEETSTKKKRSPEEGRSISEEISASVNELADAMRGYEEREESMHRELYSLNQKRYKIEESKIEMERQGFNGMVDAINDLSNSILAFTSQRTPL